MADAAWSGALLSGGNAVGMLGGGSRQSEGAAFARGGFASASTSFASRPRPGPMASILAPRFAGAGDTALKADTNALATLSFSAPLGEASMRTVQKAVLKVLRQQGAKGFGKLAAAVESKAVEHSVRRMAVTAVTAAVALSQTPVANARALVQERFSLSRSAPGSPRAGSSVTLARPVEQCVLTSCFGMRDGKHHKGIDLAAPIGTPIVASGDGVVTYWAREPGYGNVLEITHSNGFKTLYAHLHASAVRNGDTVKQGEVIAQVGNTGRSTGPHLHFEVRDREDRPIDPEHFVKY